MNKKLVNLAGWYGALAVLVAYGLASLKILNSGDVVFQLLNLTGALCLLAIAWRHRVYQLIFINAVWVIIAVFSLTTIWL